MYYDVNQNSDGQYTEKLVGESRFQSGIVSISYLLLNNHTNVNSPVENSTKPENNE